MRKITAILIAIVLLIPTFSVEANSIIENKDKLFFLECLNITDGIQKEMTDPVTRAEFTAMVVRTVKLDNLQAEMNGFDDIKEDTPFAKEIYAAKATRIANGTSQNTFSPDEPIIYDAACKELVVALGYEHKAEYLGSYPSGYFKLASELDIGDGVITNGQPLSFGDAVTMIYNALYAPVMMQSGVKGDGIIYDTAGTPLTVCFKLNCIEGVVSTAGFISDTSLYTAHNVVEISGKVFKCDFDAESFFGKSVKLWYDDRSNAIAIDENITNKEVIINVDEISGFSGNTLSAFDNNDRETKYKFDPGFAFIKNGKIINHTDIDFITSSGEARLIDNNSDNMYDYYILEAKEYFVVRSLNYADKTIYDNNSSLKNVSLLEDNEKSVKIYKYDAKNDTYTKASFDDITEGSAVELIQSDDKTVCKLIISEATELIGTVAEMGEDTIVVNGESYKFNYYFDARGRNITVGTSYNFILAPDNTITDIKAFSDNKILYGFTLGFGKGSGLSADVQMKLLTQNNTYDIYKLADSVKLDGVNKKKEDAIFETKFINGSYPVYMLIRYQLNDNNEISMIDTATSSTVDRDISPAYNGNDFLTCYSEKAYMRYKLSGNIAMPNYVLTDSVVFTVPQQLSSNPNKVYEDGCFAIGSISSLQNDKEYIMSAYDLDENYFPAAVVIFSNEATADAFKMPTPISTPFMVANVTDAVDSEGEPAKKIYGVSEGRYMEYYMSPSIVSYLEGQGKMPVKGDIVRVSLNGNKIIGLTRDVSCTSSGVKINFGIDSVSGDANSELTYIGGELLSKHASALVLSANQKPTPSTGAYLNNIAPISISSPSYTVCDLKTGEVYPGKYDSLQPSGERSQYVVCRLQYYRGFNIYIYID